MIQPIPIRYQEVFFQIVLHMVVFIFFAYRKNEATIEAQQVAFFLTFAAVAFIINYFLLPRFFYPKQYLAFWTGIILVLGAAIFAEEVLLEPYFFPGTKRAETFPGIFKTLLYDLPVIAVLCGFKFGWDAWSKQKEVDSLKDVVRESELQFLKSQINPHFLFNNLNNLYSYTLEQSPKAPEIILELSSVLRYMLYECKAEYVHLQKEVENLQNYIQLSELQIEERGKVTFTQQGIEGDYFIAPLILIVFIENAFKHSTASQSRDIHIDIHLQLTTSGRLHFHCSNTFQQQTNTDQLAKGIGLENVRKRLALMYPDSHELNINSTNDQFEVNLHMQLRKA